MWQGGMRREREREGEGEEGLQCCDGGTKEKQ